MQRLRGNPGFAVSHGADARTAQAAHAQGSVEEVANDTRMACFLVDMRHFDETLPLLRRAVMDALHGLVQRATGPRRVLQRRISQCALMAKLMPMDGAESSARLLIALVRRQPGYGAKQSACALSISGGDPGPGGHAVRGHRAAGGDAEPGPGGGLHPGLHDRGAQDEEHAVPGSPGGGSQDGRPGSDDCRRAVSRHDGADGLRPPKHPGAGMTRALPQIT